jgi:hypothetical protein
MCHRIKAAYDKGDSAGMQAALDGMSGCTDRLLG